MAQSEVLGSVRDRMPENHLVGLGGTIHEKRQKAFSTTNLGSGLTLCDSMRGADSGESRSCRTSGEKTSTKITRKTGRSDSSRFSG